MWFLGRTVLAKKMRIDVNDEAVDEKVLWVVRNFKIKSMQSIVG